MEIKFRNKKTKNLCTNLKTAKKNLPKKEAEGLMKVIDFISAAESLDDVIKYRPYNFHDLKGSRKGQYAIDINGRKSQYRLILKPLDKNIADIYTQAKTIKIITIWEVSKHYEL